MDYSPEGGERLATSSGDSNAETLDGTQIPSLGWEWTASGAFLPGPTTLKLKTGSVTTTGPRQAASFQPHTTPSHLVRGRPPVASAELDQDLRAEKATVSLRPPVSLNQKQQ